jgi:hypothetical protein
MKTFLIVAFALTVAAPAVADCITTPAGRTLCRNAAGEIVAPVAPVGAATGAVAVVPGAAVAPHAVVASPAYSNGVSTAQNAYGGKAAYNSRTGNAAVSHTNANGVTTTQTSRGGEAKTKNGMGVAQGPGGKTCAKGRAQAKCN